MFAGVIPILATPFHEDERLDLHSWQRLLEFMLTLEVDGVTILGVLGESNRLNDEERQTLIETAVTVIHRRLPIIVGTSAAGTRTAAYLSRMAQDLGADAVMVTPAKEPVPNEDRLMELYQQVAESISIPIVLQDHPASTDVHMPAGLIVRIVRAVPSIACVKEEAVPTAPKIRQIREGVGERQLAILSGLGGLYAPFDLEAGSDGFNTGFAFPEVLQALVAAARRADWLQVHRIYARFAALLVFEQQPGVAVRKELLRRRGVLASARVRHPGTALSATQAAQLDALLARTLPGVDITRRLPLISFFRKCTVTAASELGEVGERARRRIMGRLMPFLFVLYIFNYINRVNVGYAALQMRSDLGFSNTVFGFGAGIFFIGYFLLQVPSTLLTELWSARLFITVSLIVWGALAALCGLVDTAREFYWVRFFLGVAQAGFFPGVIVYLTHWFRYQDRAKAVAMFMMAIPASNMVGAAVAAALMRIDWLGWNGWRWLLILEGIPTVIFGVSHFSISPTGQRTRAGCPRTSASGSPPSWNARRRRKRPGRS